jgi:hypothetical protein
MSLFMARINPCEKQVTSRLTFLLSKSYWCPKTVSRNRCLRATWRCPGVAIGPVVANARFGSIRLVRGCCRVKMAGVHSFIIPSGMTATEQHLWCGSVYLFKQHSDSNFKAIEWQIN